MPLSACLAISWLSVFIGGRIQSMQREQQTFDRKTGIPSQLRKKSNTPATSRNQNHTLNVDRLVMAVNEQLRPLCQTRPKNIFDTNQYHVRKRPYHNPSFCSK